MSGASSQSVLCLFSRAKHLAKGKRPDASGPYSRPTRRYTGAQDAAMLILSFSCTAAILIIRSLFTSAFLRSPG
ncbi:hypothetical protein N431DRAFT_438944 [Stipitochalara longipes BDJ]|nr:hypothetical protein N431DRAFT_438944 [Stipitochalara longipes BDJ]